MRDLIMAALAAALILTGGVDAAINVRDPGGIGFIEDEDGVEKESCGTMQTSTTCAVDPATPACAAPTPKCKPSGKMTDDGMVAPCQCAP